MTLWWVKFLILYLKNYYEALNRGGNTEETLKVQFLSFSFAAREFLCISQTFLFHISPHSHPSLSIWLKKQSRGAHIHLTNISWGLTKTGEFHNELTRSCSHGTRIFHGSHILDTSSKLSCEKLFITPIKVCLPPTFHPKAHQEPKLLSQNTQGFSVQEVPVQYGIIGLSKR